MLKKLLLGMGLVFVSLSSFGADLAKGKSLSVQCSVCHGKDGLAKDPESPNLAVLVPCTLKKP